MSGDIRDPGSGEATKGMVHGAILTLAGMCAIYNAAAWVKRREVHLAANVVVYGALAAYEVWQVVHHLDRPAGRAHTADDGGEAR